MHQDAFKPSTIKKMLVIITMLAMNALSQKYGNRIGPCSSLSQHRTIDVWVKWRWCDSAMAMMRWRDNTMTMVQWHNKTIARRHDDTIAITGWCDSDDAMVPWRWCYALSRHRYFSSLSCHRHCAIVPLLYRLFCSFAIEKRKHNRQWIYVRISYEKLTLLGW